MTPIKTSLPLLLPPVLLARHLRRARLQPAGARPRRARRRLRPRLLPRQELVGRDVGGRRLRQDDEERAEPVRHRLLRLLPARLGSCRSRQGKRENRE